MKIGIIGSGIAGLAAGWFLTRNGHQVTLIEKLDRPGMAAHSIELELDGGLVMGDVPSRMFNSAQWPNLVELYNEIGVEFTAVDSTQSFCNESSDAFLHLSLPYRFGNPAVLFNKKPRQILSDMRRLRREGEHDLHEGMEIDRSFKEYLEQGSYSDEFIKGFLYPVLSSTVCTCSYKALDEYPAEIILKGIQKISVEQKLLRTRWGSRDVVERLLKDVFATRFGCGVKQIDDKGESIGVTFQNGENETFDHLVFAVQANQAGSLLSSSFNREAEFLRKIEYENVPVLIHSDENLMPNNRKQWSAFNLISNKDSAMCSVWMNRFHTEWNSEQDIFQTINPIQDPEKSKTISQIVLQRPLVTADSLKLIAEFKRLQSESNRRVWFGGSFAEPGIPLLETGVRSAKWISQQIQSRLV